LLERKELTHDDVRRLVFGSVDLIREAQDQLRLLIGENIFETRDRLLEGEFRAEDMPKPWNSPYRMEFGAFVPPSMVILDKNLPLSDRPMDVPEFASTLSLYTAVHEVIHADDHTGGEKLFTATRKHILDAHQDKLRKALEIIRRQGGCDSIRNYEDLAELWAIQYVDMVTHYRSYVVLRYGGLPKLDDVWSRLSDDFFSPCILTCIELQKGVEYVFSLFTERMGEYCLIDALSEYEEIGKKRANGYTV
jgi:hypothetical protein